MTKKDLRTWYLLREQIATLSKIDKQELIRLNHLVMEATHGIHNDNMLDGRNEQPFTGGRYRIGEI